MKLQIKGYKSETSLGVFAALGPTSVYTPDECDSRAAELGVIGSRFYEWFGFDTDQSVPMLTIGPSIAQEGFGLEYLHSINFNGTIRLSGADWSRKEWDNVMPLLVTASTLLAIDPSTYPTTHEFGDLFEMHEFMMQAHNW